MKEIILIILISTSFLGFMIGSIETLSQRDDFGKSGCEYKSIAAYFPGHWIACELFRDRTMAK
jgi:hypothetical protein